MSNPMPTRAAAHAATHRHRGPAACAGLPSALWAREERPSPRGCRRAATAELRCRPHGHRHPPPPLSFQEDGWKRVDRECAWQRFATGAAGFAAAALAFAPQACVAVDWHGAGAWRALSEAALSEVAGEAARVKPPRSHLLPRPLYLNFRVYSSGTAPSERAFYEAREVAALETAAAVLALSARDQASLRALSPAAPPPGLLLPPLRGDVRALALGGGGGGGGQGARVCVCHLGGAQPLQHGAHFHEEVGRVLQPPAAPVALLGC